MKKTTTKSKRDVYQENDEAEEAEKEVAALAESATKRIVCARWSVFALIITCGAAVSYFTYYILSSEEATEYEEGLKLFLKTLTAAKQSTVYNFFNSMNDLSEAISLSSDLSYSANTEATNFPFVTVKNFESRASHVRELGGYPSVFWAPLVEEVQADDWAAYAQNNSWWRAESIDFDHATNPQAIARSKYLEGNFTPFIYEAPKDPETGENMFIKPTYPGPYVPLWQVSPPPVNTFFVNHDKFDKAHIKSAFGAASRLKLPVYTDFFDLREASSLQQEDEVHIAFHQQFTDKKVTAESAYEHPHSMIIAPVFSRVGDPESEIVGIAGATIAWDRYLLGLLPDGVQGIYCVLKSECDGAPTHHTYKLNGEKATYLGMGDFHETAYDKSAVTVSLMNPDLQLQYDVAVGHCLYELTAYSSQEYEASVKTSLPIIIGVSVATVFVLVLIFFFIYDQFVKRRNDLVIETATRSNAVLLKLFPKQVRDRMLAETGGNSKTAAFLHGESKDGRPNADLFPETTIMFADLAGFTAWSSTREPEQVFMLLEHIYQSFDELAKKAGVFKVETIGDCYVAVCGLPRPRKTHAVVMARFAQDCMDKLHVLVHDLESLLGPDTGELSMRIGLHSGPTTAGVLRGDRARFQLFGDTMNTASRMESNGVSGKIQVSTTTASLIKQAGKEAWLSKRQDRVHAKGKGRLETYFLVTRGSRSQVDSRPCQPAANKEERLIEWTMGVIQPIMRDIIARRNAFGTPTVYDPEVSEKVAMELYTGAREYGAVKETVRLPQKFYASVADKECTEDPKDVVLEDIVVKELHAFITKIASLYRPCPFHSFEHAAHVCQSVSKMLSRIVGGTDSGKIGLKNHHRSFGITSDPYTSFAAVLAALAHDIGHYGVPNAQLINEGHTLTSKYGDKSVAEQHSFDVFWNLFMSKDYIHFRKAICCNDKALLRFRDLVLTLIMATDISDKRLKQLRDDRWKKAFDKDQGSEQDPIEATNRKATIVLEHLIQASDVSHTMQHWHIYIKFNKKLFFEMTKAYMEGRAEKDPASFWYQGEIGFFDFYIIPLAHKLASCGVFGVSSFEYLNYALSNRSEWEERGQSVLEDMIREVKQKSWYKDKTPQVKTVVQAELAYSPKTQVWV